MSLTIADVKNRFSEFELGTDAEPNEAADTLVTAALAGAEVQVDRTIFATTKLADEAVLYLTAHLLARSLPAVNARLQKSRGDDNLHTGEDVYWPVYERLARAASVGFRST